LKKVQKIDERFKEPVYAVTTADEPAYAKATADKEGTFEG
jgi:hypothetical protein